MAITGALRFHVLTRDNYTCRYCGRRAPEVRITVDHVVPIALGGNDQPRNLTACCYDCNEGKAATLPSPEVVADVAASEAVESVGALNDLQLHPHGCDCMPMFVCSGCPNPIIQESPGSTWIHYYTDERKCDSIYGTVAGPLRTVDA